MIFLDLDGVFADFDGFVLNTLGCRYSEYPPSEAWPHLAKIPHLFAQLEPLPQARELYSEICAIARMSNQRVQFLTALPQLTGLLHTAVQDKTTWVHTHLDSEASVVCVPNWRYKSMFCRQGDVLVDDSPRNAAAWQQAGGTAVLHTNSLETVEILRLRYVL